MPSISSPENVLCVARRCFQGRCLIDVQRLQIFAEGNGLQGHAFVSDQLLSLLVGSGGISNAQKIFDRVPCRSNLSWNSLINGYIVHKMYDHAFILYERMQTESVQPDASLVVSLIKTCAKVKDLVRLQRLHAHVAQTGLLRNNLYVGNVLVHVYMKCEALAKAKEAFDMLGTRDVVTWTTLIAGYAEHGYGAEALRCYERMLSDGVCPNAYTFSCVLRSCASTRSIDMGIKIHGDIEEMEQVRSNPYVCNALVDMYMKCGMSLKAREVFKCNPVRDVVSWTSLVVGCIMEGQCEEAMNCFKQMQSEGFQPNAISFTCMLNACSYTNAVKEGRALHAEIEKKGLHESDLLVGTALVNMYMKCGLLDKGLEVFNKLPVQDLVTWTALIVGYVGHADVEEAFMYYSQMQVEGFFPDSITMTSVLKACSGLGRAQVGKEVHTRLLAMELLDKDATLCNGLISMYAKYGLLADAQKVFNNTQTHDVISWTALIMGYAQSGDVDDVTCLFDEMISKGIRPDSVTFITVLNACSHSGLVEKGQTYFEAMSEVYGLVPISRHHACMIDLHCRMGQIAEAVALAYRLPFHPCSSMWRRLLSACQNLRELEYGSHLFEQSVQANDNDAALYVFMGNIMTMSRYKVQLPEYV